MNDLKKYAETAGSGRSGHSYNRQLEGRDEPILEPDLPILDAHHHLYDLPGRRYLLDDYLDDARAGHRIMGSVYVETQAFARATGDLPMRGIGEVEFANGVGAMADSGRYGLCRICAAIVGYVDMRGGRAVAEFLDRALSSAPDRLRGIRQITIEHPSVEPYRYIIHPPEPGILQSDAFHTGFRELAVRGLSFDAAVFHHQLPLIARLADEFPNTLIILNHLGMACSMEQDAVKVKRQDVFLSWREKLLDVARRGNVLCKIGGLGLPFWGFGFEKQAGPVGYRELADAWQPYVETAIAIFGTGRCMMESNYPTDSRSCGFVPLWNALKFIVRAYSPAEKTALFCGTAARVYRIHAGPDIVD